MTRQVLEGAILRLEIEPALDMLAQIFPAAPDQAVEFDYAEPAGPRGTTAYTREHAEIFAPMQSLFRLVREIATAVTHEVGAFG